MFKYSNKIKDIPADKIAPNPRKTRGRIDAAELDVLRDSIIEYGLLHPITVRRVSGGYELVAGERRYRACVLADMDEIPCVVVDADDEECAILSLVENLHREDLSFFEIAENYRNLIHGRGMTPAEAAEKIGGRKCFIMSSLRLLRLPIIVKKYIKDYNLTEGHARALMLLDNEESQIEAVRIMCNDGLNVVQSEALVREFMENKEKRNASADTKKFTKAVKNSVELMKQTGINAEMEEKNFDWGAEYIIKVRKEAPKVPQKTEVI